MLCNFKLPGLFALVLCLNAETLTPDVRAALNAIRPAELEGDLSFLASDALQGRFTPSPGLTIASEFIAPSSVPLVSSPAATPAPTSRVLPRFSGNCPISGPR